MLKSKTNRISKEFLTLESSPHMRWEAVDIRDRLYTEKEKGRLDHT